MQVFCDGIFLCHLSRLDVYPPLITGADWTGEYHFCFSVVRFARVLYACTIEIDRVFHFTLSVLFVLADYPPLRLRLAHAEVAG